MTLPKRLPTSLCSLAFVLMLASAAAAGPDAGLTVVPENGTLCTAPGAARCDFGRFGFRPALVHVFRLRNSAAVPLTLYNLHSSCGCTTAVAGGSQKLPMTVLPGRSVAVRVTLDTSALSPGFVDKTVWVEAYAPSGPVPTAQLELTGTYGPASSPSALRPPGPAARLADAAAGAALTAGQPAPDFALADIAGQERSVAGFRGHPAVLFFFCGCPWCADCARQWARAVQAGTVLPKVPALVVFSGDAAAAHRFSRANGLNSRRTVLLPDPTLAVTERRYRLNTCPRVFVLDAEGTIRYTNDHSADTARVAPAAVIISRATAALAAAH